MDSKEHREFAEGQLDRVLGFFPRVDAKASAIFAIDTALLALLCLNLHLSDLTTWLVAPAIVAALIVTVSLYFVFVCSFPHLAGGEDSLIYFREIAKRTETTYIDQARKSGEDALLKDILGQVWRNSKILKIKFDAVKSATILTLIALVPWLFFLAASATYHGQVPTVH